MSPHSTWHEKRLNIVGKQVKEQNNFSTDGNNCIIVCMSFEAQALVRTLLFEAQALVRTYVIGSSGVGTYIVI